MRIFLSCILFFTISIAYSQNLKNTEWTNILVEKKDGSQLTDKMGRDGLFESYFFKDSTVVTSINHQFSSESHYSVDKGILTIGNFLKYSIDTLTNILLEITEIPQKAMPDNEINTYAFIKRQYLFEYLKENNQVEILGDTLIHCTQKFAPEYPGNDLPALLRMPFKYREDSVFLSGFFIIDPDKKIKTVHLDPSASLNKREANAFEKAVKRTGRSWLLPVTDKPYSFKMDFHCFFKKFLNEVRQRNFHTSGSEFYIADIKFFSE